MNPTYGLVDGEDYDCYLVISTKGGYYILPKKLVRNRLKQLVGKWISFQVTATERSKYETTHRYATNCKFEDVPLSIKRAIMRRKVGLLAVNARIAGLRVSPAEPTWNRQDGVYELIIWSNNSNVSVHVQINAATNLNYVLESLMRQLSTAAS